MNPVTFSTLACPAWSPKTIIAKAAEFGYEGIEWRGGPQGHVQPTMSSLEKRTLRKMSEDAGLSALAVTSYTSFVSPSVKERQSNIDELKHYADLAVELGAPYVRAFLGELTETIHLDAALYGNISACLNKASEYATSLGVRIAVEPHDDFARSSAVLSVLALSDPDVLVIWDIGNAFAAGEDPVEGFELLKDRIAYVQVKDGVRSGTHWQLCMLGQGNVPLVQAFELLHQQNYKGALSVEWEYAWHPELSPPEIALPAALQVVKGMLSEMRSGQKENLL
jgi:sugar phosphate isomerase/epimerase